MGAQFHYPIYAFLFLIKTSFFEILLHIKCFTYTISFNFEPYINCCRNSLLSYFTDEKPEAKKNKRTAQIHTVSNW